MQRIQIIDSHTGGEPTRLVIGGFPDLGSGSMAERRALLAAQHDAWRAATVLEPRGNDVIVGALLCEPVDKANAAGVVFFNNTGYLGMCGHGTIGLVASLAHMGRIQPGVHGIETPVGTVSTTLPPMVSCWPAGCFSRSRSCPTVSTIRAMSGQYSGIAVSMDSS